jgi:hypothetical protein
MLSRLRRARVHVFRSYLKNLTKDFSRLHRIARTLVLSAPQDQPQLARDLFTQSVVFWFAMGLAHWRLTMYSLGIGSVPVSGLLENLEWLQQQVRLTLLPAGSAA